jgi:hypothetical protein
VEGGAGRGGAGRGGAGAGGTYLPFPLLTEGNFILGSTRSNRSQKELFGRYGKGESLPGVVGASPGWRAVFVVISAAASGVAGFAAEVDKTIFKSKLCSVSGNGMEWHFPAISRA